MKKFLERKTLQESPRSPSATSTPIRSPYQQTSFIEEVQVTMPVTEELKEHGVEQQIIEAEKEKDEEKVSVEPNENTKKLMTKEEFEKIYAGVQAEMEKLFPALYKPTETGIPDETKEDDNIDVEQCDDDENDNLSAAKVWAQQQKQTCIK